MRVSEALHYKAAKLRRYRDAGIIAANDEAACGEPV
jgi:hypothetical protein